MATIQWATGVSGDWATGTDWTGGVAPGGSDVAVVSMAGTYTVTIDSAEAANALTLNDVGATILDTAPLTIGTALTLTSGVFQLASGGKINGGTLSATSGTFAWNGGTLSGATYRGTLDLSAANASLYLAGGFAATGAGGTGPGLIDLTGPGSKLLVTVGETLDNATVDIGGASPGVIFYVYDPTDATPTLTLGSHFNVVQTGAIANIASSGYTNDSLINNGTITAGLSGGTFYLTPFNITNNGAITASNGDMLFIDPTTFTEGSTGTLSVTSGATLKLGYSLTTAQLVKITDSGGFIGIAGSLTNTSSTLTVGPGAADPTVELDTGGVITGGTILDKGSGLQFDGGTLSGVTYDGVLDLSTANALVAVNGGLTATTTSGTGAGTINLTGGGTLGAEMGVLGGETLDNATLNIGNASVTDILALLDPNDATPTLTLGSNFHIVQTGALAGITDINTNANDSVVNDGVITAAVKGAFVITLPNFTNNGTIAVSNGDDLFINAPNFTEGPGGSMSVAAGSELDLGYTLTTAQLLQIANAGTIGIGGTLTNTSATLSVGPGTTEPNLLLGVSNGTAVNGTISGGTIVDKGSGVEFGGGTLSNVTYDGTLDLSGASASVIVANGFVATGVSGTGAGTVDLTGSGATFSATGGETLDNMTVNLGSATGGSTFSFFDPNGSDTLLTLGSHFQMVQVGLLANLVSLGYAGDTLVNEGTITAAVDAGTFLVNTFNFTNNGAISVSNGDTLFLEPVGFNPGTGTVTVSSGGILKVGFALTTAQLLSEFTDNGGVIGIAGTLTNTTLNVGSGTALPAVQLNTGGTILGGTVIDHGSVMQFLGGTLSGVTYDGALNLSSAGASLIVTGGFTATGVGGTGPGAINLTGSGATFAAAGGETLDKATLSLGANASFDIYNPAGGATTLTLGSGLVINQTGASATIGDSTPTNTNDALVNDGAINAGAAGGQLTINVPIFTNNGSLTVSNGETVNLEPGTLTNLGGTTLTGGLYQVNAGSTLEFPNAAVTTDDAVIVLKGAGSVIESLNPSNGVKTSLESMLTAIGASGTLEVLGGRNWTTTNAIANAGTLQLSGGTFTATSLGNAGQIYGFGTIAAAVANTGAVWASGGQTLSLAGGLTNLSGGTLTGGILQVGAAGTLQLANNTSIATLNATIDLTGVGANLQSLNTTTSKQVSLESSLTTIDAAGLLEVLGGRNYSTANTITNSGRIVLAGGTLTAGKLVNAAGSSLSGFGAVAAVVSNAGAISVQAGDTLSLPNGLTNLSGTTFTGGSWIVGAGGTLQLANNTSIATLDATVDLAGPGAKIQSLNTTTSKQVSLEAALTSIGASGVLEILGSRGYATSLAITNVGTIQLGGGALATGKLTDSAGSNLTGFGTVASVFSDAGTVTVSGGTLTFSGTGDTFAGHVAGGGLIFSGGSEAFNAGVSLAVTSWTVTNGAAVSINTTLTYAGTVTQGAGTTLSVSAGDTLTLDGASSSLAGTAGGAGTLAFAGGANTLASSLALSVAKLTVAGSATSLTLGSSRTYAGDFVQSGGTLTTGAFTLTLSGPASFGSSLVTGSGGLALQGATAVGQLTIGGTEAVTNTGTVTQTGKLTVGDATTSAASFTNASAGVYDIANDSGIAKGTAAGSLFTNAGTLAKTAGTGVSLVAIDVTDTGTIKVASGTLEFSGASNSFTGTASGAGTLELGGGANTLSAGLTLSVAKVLVAGSATSVTFGSSRTYAGDFVQSGGAVKTGAFTLTLSGPATFGPSALVTGAGGLALQGATAISGLTIGGTEAATNTGTVTQTGKLTVGDATASAASFTNASGGVYDITNDTGIGKGTAARSLFTNAGTLAKTAGTGVSAVGVDVTDTGTIHVASGTLEFDGAADSFSGSLDGPGTVALGAGASSLSTLDLAGGVTLTNAGTVSQSGVVTLTNGKVTNKAGASWNFTSDNGVTLASGGSGSLTNTGTLAKTAGTGVSHIGVDVTSSGTLTAATGTLELDGASNSFSGSFDGPGAVALGAGASSLATVSLAGGVALTNAGKVSQSGVVTVTSGTITNEAGATWNFTTDNGVALAGTGSLTNAGTLAKTAGTGVSHVGAGFTNTGTVTVATGTLEFDGALNSFSGAINGPGTLALGAGASSLSTLDLAGGVALTNAGTVSQSGVLTLTNGTVTNQAGATWNFTSDNGVTLASGGSGSLANGGTLAKTAGTGVTHVGVDVTDTGTVTAATGTIEFDGPADSFSGALDGPGTVALGAGASSLSTLDLAGGVALTNAGTVSQSGVLTLTSGTLTNKAGATWNLTADNGVALGGSGSLTNAGTLAKTAGTGVSAVGAGFTNTGTITVATGALEFDGATNSFAGTIGGAGAVTIAGGSDALTGVKLTVADVNITSSAVTLSGAISNTGAVTVTGVVTVAAAGASLTGAGTITLSDHATNEITGATAASVLTVDTTLEGVGKLGAGKLTLVNQAGGTIESLGITPLTIDTGTNVITNAGLIESMGAPMTSGVTINSAVNNTGTLASGASNLTVNGAVTGAGHAIVGAGILYFASTFTENVTFAAGSTGTLDLSHSQTYTGSVSGFSTSGANTLNLDDISYGVFTSASYSGTTSGGTLTVTDGTHTAKITLVGNYLGSTFSISPDANFGTAVTDPAASGQAAIAAASGQATIAAPSGQATIDATHHRFIAAMAGLGAGSAGSFDSLHFTPLPMHMATALAHPASMQA